MKTIRKLTAALLTGSLLLVPAVVPVSASADDSSVAPQQNNAALEQKAREEFHLPADQWKITSSKSETDRFPKRSGWSLEFEGVMDDVSGQTVSVFYDQDGTLCSFSRNDKRTAIGTVSHAEATKRAEAFLQSHVPGYAGQLVLVSDGYEPSFGLHLYEFERMVNGISVLKDHAQVAVGNDGEVTVFMLWNWTKQAFPSAGKVITLGQAQTIYQNALDLRLRFLDDEEKAPFSPYYRAFWASDYDPETINLPLRGLILDASTGQRLQYNGQPAGDLTVPADLVVPPTANSVAEPATKLTQEAAEQRLQSTGLLPEGSVPVSAKYSEGKKRWSLEYKSFNVEQIRAELDAYTGEFVSVSNYMSFSTTGPLLSDAQLRTKAIEWLNKLYPNRTEPLVLKIDPDSNDHGSFDFCRAINGIVSKQGVKIGLNKSTGEVRSVADTRPKDRKAEDYTVNPNLLTVEQAKAKYAEQFPMQLGYYQPTEGAPMRLVYSAQSYFFPVQNSVTGELVGLGSKTFVPSPLPSQMQGHWAEPALRLFAERKVLSVVGDDASPDKPLTRAELVALLTKFLTKTGSTKMLPYKDLSPDEKFIYPIMTAYSQGWIAADTHFRPDDTITREEAATILARVISKEVKDGTSGLTPNFADGSEISPWALSSVGLLQQKGLMNGDAGKFHPQQNITLAEMCTILVNLTKLTNRI